MNMVKQNYKKGSVIRNKMLLFYVSLRFTKSDTIIIIESPNRVDKSSLS